MYRNIHIIPLAVLLCCFYFGTVSAAEIVYENIVFSEPVVFDPDMEFWAELDSDGNVYMDWSKYNHAEPFGFYKIVRSDTNPDPVYPQDGYVYFTDDINTLTFTETDVPFGEHYYRICHVAGEKRYCSEETHKIVKKAPILLERNLAIDKIAINPDLLSSEKADAIAEADDTDAGESANGESETAAGEEDVTENAGNVNDDTGTKVENRIIPEDRPIRQIQPEKVNSFESFISEYWVQFLALVVSLVGVALAVTGFTLAGAKKKKSISKLINEIDDTFASFKWKTKRCEAELYRLQDVVEDELKSGKLDEGSYQLLLSRIDKYLSEIKEIDTLPEHLKDKP